MVFAGAEPELHEVVARLAASADVPPPSLAIARSREANSFIVALTLERGTIVVTSELLRRLDRSELEAVLAHEVAHMANRDGVVMTFVFAPAMLGSLLLRPPRAFALLLLYLPVWLFGLRLLWRMARAREYYADRAAALITGAPEQLMSALQELRGMKAKGDLRGGAEPQPPAKSTCHHSSGPCTFCHPYFQPISSTTHRISGVARSTAAPVS